jgi:hypothetical protein
MKSLEKTAFFASECNLDTAEGYLVKEFPCVEFGRLRLR